MKNILFGRSCVINTEQVYTVKSLLDRGTLALLVQFGYHVIQCTCSFYSNSQYFLHEETLKTALLSLTTPPKNLNVGSDTL